MARAALRMGIAGCGAAARIHLDRLLALDAVEIVGCADPDLHSAQALADRASLRAPSPHEPKSVPAFSDYRDLLQQQVPDAVAIFAPHLAHYRVTMDALQRGCHVFIEKPLSTNLQEAADIVSLARGRHLKVGVGHQFRLCPSLVEARRRLASGAIGPLRLVTAILARPWVADLDREESQWRFHLKAAGGGILADAGDHLIDALLWTTGQVAGEVGAVQSERDRGIDLVTAAAIRLADGTPVTLGVSAFAPGSVFALDYFGELGHIRATDQSLQEQRAGAPRVDFALGAPDQTIDGDFVAAVTDGSPLCCPAEQALDTVRLLEAIARSATTGQIVRLT
jgi:predicted dehydrogenase